MTLLQRITLLINSIGGDVKLIGSRNPPAGGTTGQTLTKSSNTDYAYAWTTPAATGATIDDTAPASNKAYSSTKTDSQIAAAKAAVKSEILGTASAAYDTLKELQDIIVSDESAASALATAVGVRVAVDQAQSFTTAQKTQGRANIDAYGLAEIGNPDTDLVALYTAAKA